jgi:endo-1,4-beta-mannosidase
MVSGIDRFTRVLGAAVLLIAFVLLHGFGEPSQVPASWSWPPIRGFMTASGTGLQGGLKFMGANLDPWRFNTAIGEVYSQAEIGQWVANAVRYAHARVIRMHMNGGAFEPSVGAYGESAFKQLDYLLAAAAQNDVYVLIALRDYCWTPWPPGRCYDPYWYMNGGSEASPGKDNILTQSNTIAAFRGFISYVVNRVNTVTAVRYKDDPRILGWEILNEPNMVSGIKNWFVDISAYVKSVDPNHLVGVATGDTAQSGWEPGAANWEALKIPQLDFVDIHYYADFYSPRNTAWASRYSQILQSVMTLNKPVINGEFGCPNTYALAKITNLYQTIVADSLGGGLSGVMPYSWGPPGPNSLGGPGSFCIYTDEKSVCELLRDLAP